LLGSRLTILKHKLKRDQKACKKRAKFSKLCLASKLKASLKVVVFSMSTSDV